jgi:hypothetical protein
MQELLFDSLVQAIAKKVMAKISFPHLTLKVLPLMSSRTVISGASPARETRSCGPVSNTRSDGAYIVFCESAIFALSHTVLFRNGNTCHAPIGGKPNPVQPELIRAVTAVLDAEGRKLAQVVKRAVEMSNRGDLHFHIHEPSGFKDWNDQLRAKPKSPLPYRPEQPLMPGWHADAR